ncbi:MAG: amidase [Thermodesulfobacteriota bacterium]
MDDLVFQPALTQIRAIRNRAITSRELLDLYLERVTRLNPGINAVVAMDADGARRQADEADAALSKGQIRGPLHGLPMTVKDSFEVVGMPCTSGAPELRHHQPAENADAVQSLIDAGAVVFGKTNMPLYGADIQTYNSVYGRTNNPWRTDRTPGGSSGGAAAALAAGLCGLEIGSDIGGSIRTPAHFCGIFGHKPSYGIVPDRGHIPPPPGIFTGKHSLSVDILASGPLARSAEDLAVAMDILAGPERAERKAWRIRLPAPRKKNLKKYRIGLWLDDPVCPVDAGVGDVIQNAVDALSKTGAQIRDIKPQVDFHTSHQIFLSLLAAVMGSGVPQAMFNKWLETSEKLDADDRSYLASHIRGATQLHLSWIRNDVIRQILRQKWADFFEICDVLLCPPAPVAAFPHDHQYLYERTVKVNGSLRPYLDLMAWAGLAGVSYLPATVAPVGMNPEGLPVGIQIIGPYLEDRTTIHVAGLISEVMGGFRPPPGF